MDWLVVVCGCGEGELFRYGLSVLRVLNNCVVCWMRCRGGWSGFVFSWGKFEFVSSGFFVCLFYFGLFFRWSSTNLMIDNSALS